MQREGNTAGALRNGVCCKRKGVCNAVVLVADIRAGRQVRIDKVPAVSSRWRPVATTCPVTVDKPPVSRMPRQGVVAALADSSCSAKPR